MTQPRQLFHTRKDHPAPAGISASLRGIGISTRVMVGLAVIVVTMLATSLTIGYTFGRASTSISTITMRDLPTLITTFSLVRESERMQSVTPDLLATENPFIREALSAEFFSRVHQWEKLAAIIAWNDGNDASTSDLVRQARALHDNISAIGDVIDERMKTDNRMVQISRHIRRIGEGLNQEFSNIGNLNLEHLRHCQQIIQNINQATIVLLSVNIASTPEEIERLESRFRLACLQAEEKLPQIPADIRQKFSAFLKEYFRFSYGEDSLFALAAGNLVLKKCVEDHLVANQFISGGIMETTNTILADIKASIEASTQTLGQEMEMANHLAKVLPAVSLLCSMLIIAYLKRSVIARILSLSRAMEDHVHGRPGLIAVRGNDEISTMARAANSFIHEITKREKHLRESEIKYRNLFEMAPVGIYRMDARTGSLLDSNDTAPAVFGYDDKTSFMTQFSHELCFKNKKQLHDFTMRMVETGHADGFEALVRRADGALRHLVISSIAYPDSGYLECAVIDMTEIMQAKETLRRSHEELERIVERRTREINRQNEILRQEIQERVAAEKALGESEKRFRLLAENLREVLCLVEIESRQLLYANPAFEKLFDVRADAFQKQPSLLMERIHTDDREYIAALLHTQWGTAALEGQAVEYRLSMPDGRTKWVMSRVMHIRDDSKKIVRAAIMAEDITGRKQAEKIIRDSERRLKYLSTKLLEAQEEERRNLAAELHDNIGPSLGAAKFGVESVMAELKSDCKDQQETLLTVVGLIKNTVRLIGRLQMELRPSIIDDFGIIEALDWYCQDYMTIYRRVTVQQRIQVNEKSIPQYLHIIIYRIVQEAFNNIAKHSGADRIHLTLKSEGDILTLTIADNGEGFDAFSSPGPDKRKGLGLVSMRERAELSAGSFHISSSAENGTRIECQWDCQMVRRLEEIPA